VAGNLWPIGTVSEVAVADAAHMPLSRSHTGWSDGQHEEPSLQHLRRQDE
jgi:hypothetical protein